MKKALISLILAFLAFKLDAQVFTNQTIGEIKNLMKNHYPKYLLNQPNGYKSNVVLGGDTLMGYEYWGIDKDSNFSSLIFYSKLDRVVIVTWTKNISNLSRDINNFDIIGFKKDSPPIDGFDISYTDKISADFSLGFNIYKDGTYCLTEWLLSI